jgi:hypothetical protein
MWGGSLASATGASSAECEKSKREKQNCAAVASRAFRSTTTPRRHLTTSSFNSFNSRRKSSRVLQRNTGVKARNTTGAVIMHAYDPSTRKR